MSETEFADSERILILAPTGRDASLASSALQEAGLACHVAKDMLEFCDGIYEGAGAGMVTEEALDTLGMNCLRDELERQPAWSDFPLVIFTSRPSAELTVRSFEMLGPRANTTLIERPIRVKTMVSAAAASLRARKRQYEIRDLLRELQRRVDERDQFLAMLSHELRNPLAAISLAVDSLGNNGSPTAERDIVARQTRHLRNLVDDLLDISRITSGKIVLHKSKVDLADIVEHTVESLRPQIGTRQHSVEVRTSERTIVDGDPVRLEQIANNLISNAIKYTPTGGHIEVIVEREGDGKGDAVLRVRDTGKGISREMLTRIFDLFMQGDVTIDRSEGGMGIGLTLVRKLTEMHGGSIRAFSEGKGRGSEFVARFPLANGKPGAAAEKTRPAPKRSTPRRIIVIEDNPDIRDLLCIKLRQLGHTVESAEDGNRGLEMILTNKPEVALVDIGLPGLDGYGVAGRVRDQLGSSIYLVALTGYGQSEDRARALEAGFDVHLTKPADIADLQTVLGRVGRGGASTQDRAESRRAQT